MHVFVCLVARKDAFLLWYVRLCSCSPPSCQREIFGTASSPPLTHRDVHSTPQPPEPAEIKTMHAITNIGGYENMWLSLVSLWSHLGFTLLQHFMLFFKCLQVLLQPFCVDLVNLQSRVLLHVDVQMKQSICGTFVLALVDILEQILPVLTVTFVV